MGCDGGLGRRSFGTDEERAVTRLPERAPDPAEERPGHSCLRPIAFGILLTVIVRLGVGAAPVESGEPILLRWLRILADHPLRAALAASLAFVALRPRGPSR
jgi:hypothetical protein